MEQRAKGFATHYHNCIGHRNQYTGKPYINHPEAVAAIVRSVPHSNAMICAAWLHDTVKYTQATLVDIETIFGTQVATLVKMLTNAGSLTDGNLATQKASVLAHIARASTEAKTIELADIIDTMNTIVEHDPEFAKRYAADMLILLNVLKEGNQTLWDRAYAMCIKFSGQGDDTVQSETKMLTCA
jgi:(p)ppGpp synthase/HD superfamily hydrolase